MGSDQLPQYTPWANGAPRAATISEARLAWKPNLAEWGRLVKTDFWGQTSSDPGAARLGWIEDAAFWTDLWAGVEKERTQSSRNANLYEHRIGLFVREAGFLCNMNALVTLPQGSIRTLVMNALCKEDVLIAHPVVEWFDGQGIGKNASARMPSKLLNMQQYSWSRVQWKAQPNDSPIVRKSMQGLAMEQVVNFLKHAVAEQHYAPFVQLNALGHAMVNAPSQWFVEQGGQPLFVQALRASLGHLLSPQVDLDLVALCSGYGSNGSDVYKGIKSLGRHFTGGKTSIGNKKPASPEIQVVLAMCDITDALSLYESVQVGGTHKLQAQESFSLDGLCEPAP